LEVFYNEIVDVLGQMPQGQGRREEPPSNCRSKKHFESHIRSFNGPNWI